MKVRVGLKEKDARVVPEMGARVSFIDDTPAAPHAAAAQGVVVPAEAVQANGATGVLFIIHDDVLEQRTVRLGARGPEGQVVLSGISPGEKLAVGDAKLLGDKVKVKVK